MATGKKKTRTTAGNTAKVPAERLKRRAAGSLPKKKGRKPKLTPEQLEVKRCLSDVEWRLDNLYYIKDKFGKVIKFKRNDSQLRLWRDRHYLNIILKDRQRGFSTFIAIIILDTCMFSSNQACGIIDITLGDASAKLEKILFAYNRLTDALKSANPLVKQNTEELKWANGSGCSAGTSYRGGTLQILHLSEMGKISARNPDKAREIRTGAMNTITTGCFIFNESTAEGTGGEFHDDCMTALSLHRQRKFLTELDYKFHFFAWWHGSHNEMDPRGVTVTADEKKYFRNLEKELGITLSDRKRAWYVKKSAQQKDDMLREYPSTPEEAFKASIDGAYLAKQMAQVESEGRITVVPYDPACPVNTGWDFGLHDTMTIWLHQFVGMQHRIIGYVQGVDDDVLYYWKELKKLDYIWGKHFLPHDGDARRIGTAKSAEELPRTLEEILNEAGMRNTEIIPRITEKYTAIQEVRQWLPKVWIDESSCAEGIKCLKNFKREWDDKNGCWKNKPKHDWAQHGYDGLESLVRGLSLYGDSVELSNVSVSHSYKPAPPPNAYY